MRQSREVSPFPALLCLLSEPLLAQVIVHGGEVPVTVNQKILQKKTKKQEKRANSIILGQINRKRNNIYTE